uniref:BHLH domain-containing protein n=1 Tax=Parascaris univalens TaxID=6257 RepID=A0A915BVX3_PARUN
MRYIPLIRNLHETNRIHSECIDMNQSVKSIRSRWKIFAVVEPISLKRLTVRFCASRHLKRQVVDSASLISIISCQIQFTIEPLHVTSHCVSSQRFAGILSLFANTIVSIHFFYLLYFMSTRIFLTE